MTQYRVSYIIDGLHDVIPRKEDRLLLSNVLFHYRGEERVGTVSLDRFDETKVELEALQQIKKSLSKICFAYNTEAFIRTDGIYVVDSSNPSSERIGRNFTFRWSSIKIEPQFTLEKIQSVTENKRDLLDLALAYYSLGYYNNPLRIETFFSSLTVIVRELSGIYGNQNVPTSILKAKIKEVLRKRDVHFDDIKFDKNWKDCYAEERCSIAHGRGSKLIALSSEHDKIVNLVHYWTREVIYAFIDKHQNHGSNTNEPIN